MGQNHDKGISDLESRFHAAGKSGNLGRLNDQDFYAVRYESARPLEFPFAQQKFGALLNLAAATSREELEKIARQLLEHGLAYALCAGDQAEEMSEIIDRLIDEGAYSNDGFTPYTSVEDGLSEALEYFVLPTGITSISLIITIGNNDDQGSALDLFDNLFGGEIESPEDLEWFTEAMSEIFAPALV